MTVLPGKSACYRCIFNAPPTTDEPAASTAGVMGVLPCVIGGIEATEALKYLLGIGDLLTDHILTYDALKMTFRKIAVQRNSDCPLCGDRPSIVAL